MQHFHQFYRITNQLNYSRTPGALTECFYCKFYIFQYLCRDFLD